MDNLVRQVTYKPIPLSYIPECKEVSSSDTDGICTDAVGVYKNGDGNYTDSSGV